MANYRIVFLLNTLAVLLVAVVSFALKWVWFFGKRVIFSALSCDISGAGFFFLMFQMLFYFSVMVCVFSFGLLRTTQPNRPENQFILGSAIVTGFFLFNEVFRTHVHLGRAGFPKVTIVIIYAVAAAVYGLTFRRQIKSTPYFLLVSGVGLLFLAFFAEALPWKDEAISSLLEGIPKLLSGVNIALYFWFVCKGLILRSLNFYNKTSNPELSKFN